MWGPGKPEKTGLPECHLNTIAVVFIAREMKGYAFLLHKSRVQRSQSTQHKEDKGSWLASMSRGVACPEAHQDFPHAVFGVGGRVEFNLSRAGRAHPMRKSGSCDFFLSVRREMIAFQLVCVRCLYSEPLGNSLMWGRRQYSGPTASL